MELAGINTSPGINNMNDSISATKRKNQSTTKTKDSLVQAEKGWIKLSTKMDTHNFHLKNKQAVSVAAFQVCYFPLNSSASLLIIIKRRQKLPQSTY